MEKTDFYKINILKNNRGSVVVEISLIIPVILGIIILSVFLFIDSINNSILRTDSYVLLYTYSVEDDKSAREEECVISINNRLVGMYYIEKLNVDDNGEEISVSYKGDSVLGGKIHKYMLQDKTYKSEYALCTKRLRRWQLYGDIIQQ